MFNCSIVVIYQACLTFKHLYTY